MATTDSRSRIHWPRRCLFLLLVGPATVVGTGFALKHSHPELVGQLVTDHGDRVVVVGPVEGGRAQ